MMREMLADLAAAAVDDRAIRRAHGWHSVSSKRDRFVLFTSDTGLAGAFNSNLLKAAQQVF